MTTALFTPAASPDAPPSAEFLHRLAIKLRLDALEMIFDCQSGHPGSSFSCMDLLVALWFGRMRHDASRPEWSERDRFVLSKGHAAPALYAVLLQAGYIPWEEKLTLRKVHSNLQGHPASKYVKGVDISTGSLGQGLSAAVGMCLGLRLDENPARVFCLMGDGECQEGNVWEAVMSGAHHRVSRLTAIVDRNRLQIDGSTEKVKHLGEMAPKFAAFEWNVLEIDGHDYRAIAEAIAESDRLADASDRPTVIIANTIKGKGVSFMENQAGWHGKAPNREQFEQAATELRAALASLGGWPA